MAVLLLPTLVSPSAPSPKALLFAPEVLRRSEYAPAAVFEEPVLLESSESNPRAVLLNPLAFAKRASVPTPVLNAPVLWNPPPAELPTKAFEVEPKSFRNDWPPTVSTPAVELVVLGNWSSLPLKLCPEAKVMMPLLLIERPVSFSVPPPGP